MEKPRRPSHEGGSDNGLTVVQPRLRGTAAAARQQPQQQQLQRRQQRRPPQQRTLQFQRSNGPPAAAARADAVRARTCDVHALNECWPGSARGCTCRCACGASAAQKAGRGGGERARGNPPPRGNRGNNITQGNTGTSRPGQRQQPRRPRAG